MTRRIACLLAVLLAVAGRTAALSRLAPSLVMLVCDADVIVTGRAQEGPSNFVATIKVSERLFGDAPGQIETEAFDTGLSAAFNDHAFDYDRDGIFFLKRDGQALVPAGWRASAPRSDLARVRKLISMRRHPGDFVMKPDSRGDPDLAFLIGRAFWSYRVQSADAPMVGDALEPDPWDPPANEPPFAWTRPGVRTYEFSFDSSRTPALQAQRPGDEVDLIRRKFDEMVSYLKERPRIPRRWPGSRRNSRSPSTHGVPGDSSRLVPRPPSPICERWRRRRIHAWRSRPCRV